MQATNARATGAISAQHGQSARASARHWQQANIGQAISKSLNVNGLSSELSRLSGVLAGAFSAGAAVNAADAYARFTNSLRVSGLEGENLAQVQARLSDIGRENATGLESLGSLYGSIAQKSRELGSSQSEILTVVENVAMAIRVSGQSAEAAQGALLQMGQALGAGTVRAEEFNSIQEGLPTLLNAAAAASEKYGGSVAKMREEVTAGKLSSQEFMNLILAASTALEEQASRATLTFGQSMTVLRNALVEYVGKADQSVGASAALAQGIATLAQNLDKIALAIQVIVVALASRYTAAAITAGVATVRLTLFQSAMTASMLGVSRASLLASSAMKALNTAMTFMGGPLGVTLALIGGLAIALNHLGSEYNTTAVAARELDAVTAGANAAIDRYADAVAAAKRASGEERVELLKKAEALREVTEARIQDARVAARRQQNEADAATRTAARTQTQADNANRNYGSGGFSEARSSTMGGANAQADGAAEIARRSRIEASRAWEAVEQMEADAKRASQGIRRTSGAGSSNTTSTGSGRGRGSGSQTDYAANDARALHDAQMVELAARIALAETVADRHRLEDEKLAAERKAAIEAVEKNDQLTASGKAQTIAAMRSAHALEDTATQHERALSALDEAQRIERETLEAQGRIADIEDRRLSILADMATTEAERWRLEDEAIASRRDRERRQRQLEIDHLEAQAAITRDAQERARLLAQAQAKRDEGAAQEALYGAEDSARRSDRRSGLQRYFDDVSTTTLDQSEVMLNAFQSLESGLGGVIDGTKTLAEVWRDVASSIIADIARVAIRQMILKPIMSAMGLDFGGGELTKVKGKFASGTNFVSESGIYDVGENGRERVFLPRGSKVMPANVLKASEGAMRGGAAVMAPTYNLTTVINADNAVMRSDIDRMVAQAHIMAVQRAKAETIGELATRDRSRLR